MKKQVLTLALCAISFLAYSQKAPLENLAPEFQELPAQKKYYAPETESSSTLLYSEDFSSGIPSNWSQNGTPSAALWQYRGPNTSPPSSVGSIGCWAGPLQAGNQGSPITSATAANGFVIFDSDFYHSNGDRATNGQGPVPAPHIGRLTTSTYDFSTEPAVELIFTNYLRRFQSAFFVVISLDGGTTFTDSIEVFPVNDIAVNQSTASNEILRLNISHIVGNQSNVAFQFVFDGTVGSGRYYWMIDDMELRTPPDNLLLFTSGIAPGTSGPAPAHDILFNNDGSHPKYLHTDLKQAKPISFDSNILNYGSKTQNNVHLQVDIEDQSGNNVSTLTSPSTNLNSQDTGFYTVFTTSTGWTPTTAGEYNILYKAVSDSIPASMAPADTFKVFVGDRYGLDDNTIGNFFGTNTGTNGMLAIGTRVSFENDDPTGTPGEVYLQGLEMNMSSATDSTADMEVVIFDTAGFVYGSGFPSGSTPLFQRVFSYDANTPGNRVNFSFEDNNGDPLILPTGTYFVVSTFFVNATGGVVRLANSNNWNQPGTSSIFQSGSGSWFSGFSNSTTYEAPHYRVVTADGNISLEETKLAEFSVYPNPIVGTGTIHFENGGNYIINVYDMLGNTVSHRVVKVNGSEKIDLNLEDVTDGIYLLNISGENTNKTIKLQVI